MVHEPVGIKKPEEKAAEEKNKIVAVAARKEELINIPNALINTKNNAIQGGEGFNFSIPGASQKANIQTKAEDPVIGIPRLSANFSETIKGLIEEEKKMATIPKKTALV